jgi:hypothetical protein
MKKIAVALLSLVLSTGLAMAFGEKPPMGGVLEENGPLHVELVSHPTEVKLYVYDDKVKPVAASKITIKATVLAGGKSEPLVLVAPDPNANHFVGKYALTPGARLAVEAALPGDRSRLVRFSIK